MSDSYRARRGDALDAELRRYLAGELAGAQVEQFERRLLQHPAARERLAALAAEQSRVWRPGLLDRVGYLADRLQPEARRELEAWFEAHPGESWADEDAVRACARLVNEAPVSCWTRLREALEGALAAACFRPAPDDTTWPTGHDDCPARLHAVGGDLRLTLHWPAAADAVQRCELLRLDRREVGSFQAEFVQRNATLTVPPPDYHDDSVIQILALQPASPE